MEKKFEQSFQTPDYETPEYWDNRYSQTTEMYDWYQEWEQLLPFLKDIQFTGDERVLNLGCGNSTSSYQMVETVFKSVVSIDISVVVIFQMQQKYADDPRLTWETMDCTNMSFDDESFDVVFDKGTLDALICSDQSIPVVKATFDEVARVLSPGGIFIEVSYAPPDHRHKFFKDIGDQWIRRDLIPVPHPSEEGIFHHIYVFEKAK
ncbi:Menaquinone biosynthesis methyltransferase [Tritrichomonas foetus]|uniref:Menaquinone biosynthesis methyltransferase n=1 Tax=Tritrichomonas foetus TaxID=1144522 RepID=A0A1J4KZF8_9EUKA|nr:Menaquinone biosynthesis methyltransferase [Tritrichomonas foetus]|eukprot:OHT16635.1 Menaquinone biosynthesis methyltransferase [Tritrichomonas foetus]